MHDRRLDGKTYTFGNQGALFMNAMTWWDHETASIWSQPWGLAIRGLLEGKRLKPLPMSLVLWRDWKTEHPNTLVLVVEDRRFSRDGFGFREDFVIGIALGDHARAYPFPILKREIVVNDAVGPFPIVLHANPDTRNVRVFVRRVGDRILTFTPEGAQMRDRETGSLWDPLRGLAIEGRWRGENLIQVPSNSSYDWAWLDFYPHSTEYQGRGKT